MNFNRASKQFLSFILVILCLFSFTACGGNNHTPDSPPSNDQTAPVEPSPPVTDANDGKIEMPEVPLPSDDGTVPDPDNQINSEDHGVYAFGQPLWESQAVEDTWFEDAVFLGDSRTEGLQLYSGITSGTFFWEWGMSVFKIDSEKHRKVAVGEQKMTLMEALSTGTWDKVYIMIGINDLGYPVASYQKALGEMIDRVREIQGDAMIYLQTMSPINETLAKENKISSYINNTNVAAFNEAIIQVALEKQVILLDTGSCLVDSQGQLPADMSSDGVHFKKAGYQKWLDYLKCHTISGDDYQAAKDAA